MTAPVTHTMRVSLLGVPGSQPEGYGLVLALGADSTTHLASCLLLHLSHRVLGPAERFCLEGSLNILTRI